MRIVRLAIDVPIFKTFDYVWNEESLKALPQAGDLVKVEFGNKITTGIILQENVNISCSIDQIEKLKNVLLVTNELRLPVEILQMCQFVAKYYLKPIGEVLFTAIPPDWKKPEKWELIKKQRNKSKKQVKEIKDQKPQGKV